MEKINRDTYFEYLIDTYGNLIFSICYKITHQYFDAEDLTQETFVSAYKNLDTFDGENEKAWLSKIATNKCLDYLKSAKRRLIPTDDMYLKEVKSNLPTPEETFLEEDIKAKLLCACKSLKPPYDEVAVDYFCNEMKVKDISDKTGKNIKTLQTQIYRAKEMLRKILRKECDTV